MEAKNTLYSQDLRVIKTEFAIKKAFNNLLKKKPYSKITVSEIVESAQINRNTFYLHYFDKEDLLDNIINDYFGKYNEMMKKKLLEYKNIRNNVSYEEFDKLIYSILNDIEKDIDFYRLIIKDNDMKGYIIKIKDSVRKSFDIIIDKKDIITKTSMEFCFEGSFGLIIRWIEDSIEFNSISDLAYTICKMIHNVLDTMKAKGEYNEK